MKASGIKKTNSSKPALKSRITSALRQLWRFSDNYKQCLSDYKVILSNRPYRVGYRCAACGVVCKRDWVAVDHIEAVVGGEGFIDWNTYIARLFCPVENLRVICHTCHERATKAQRDARTEARKQKKALEQPEKKSRNKKKVA